jgi:CubicO group peptidase (beta-lactamase class C family)
VVGEDGSGCAVKKVLLWLLGILGVLLAVVVGALWYLKIPSSLMGMAAHSACSGAYVAGRDPQQVFDEDVLPASSLLKVIAIEPDDERHAVTARLFGVLSRTAWLLPDRGCVLDVQPLQPTEAYVPTEDTTRAWPAGDAPAERADWPSGVDAAQLSAVVDAAMVGAGDPNAANARGVAVVQDGTLLELREAEGFQDGIGLHSWSMAKTVTGMLFHRIATDTGLDLETPVVEAFPPDREPAWVADWRADERSAITIADLLYMRDGLDNVEDYQPWSAVPRMLWSEPDAAAWAAGHPAEVPAGTRWQYLSATTNILAAVARAQFATDEEYWAYPGTALFDRIGATSATLETDASGTWLGSSYLWARITDWARLGQLMLDDGTWDGTQVLPPGWLGVATTPAVADGEGRGYGAQTWLYGDRLAGDCRSNPDVPEDTIAMGGHWGQMVAMVPSKDAVVVRMGWTVADDVWDDCQFLGDVLATLP